MTTQDAYLSAEPLKADPPITDQPTAERQKANRLSVAYYPLRWFDWTAVALLLAALITAAGRLVATEWTDHLPLVMTVTVLGLIAGLALGQSRFSPRTVLFFAVAFGLFTVPWQLGGTLQSEALWFDRLSMLSLRLGVIIYQLLNKLTVRDSLLFLVLMNFLFWGLGIHAGYVLVRYGDAWKATLPTGLAILVIHYYDPLVARRAWALAFYIFFTLVLVARMTFIRQRSRWQANRTALPPHLSLDFIRFTMLFASIIVVVAWSVPALANALPAAERLWQPVRSAWTGTVDDLNYAFASLRSTRPVYSVVYGNNATLGRGTPLSTSLIFEARAPLDTPPGTRLYWRARTFDAYGEGQWFSNIDTNYNFDPEDGNLLTPTELGRWEGDFEIQSVVNMGTIFTPAQPLWVSRAGQVQYVENPDGTLDISTFVAAPNIRPGEIYRVTASVGTPSIAELRQAGEDYPAWVTERYLQLPDNITDRTKQLAEEITAGLETPYDKAAAITQYLRENITYTEVIEDEPPPGQEVIDWFLFDLKEGFCNYYATAEIVLLRQVGIPARWSIGYAQGEELTDEALETRPDLGNWLIYNVRQKDSHAWPEVYFPGIGWIEFEPTFGQPDIQRPLDNALNPPISALDPANPPDDSLDRGDGLGEREPPQIAALSQGSRRLGYWLAGMLAILILFLAVSAYLLPALGIPGLAIWLDRGLRRLGVQPPQNLQRWAERSANQRVIQLEPVPIILEAALEKLGLHPPRLLRQWARNARLPALSLAYIEINRALSRLGRPAAATDTPIERAGALGALVPLAQEPAHRLVQEYQIETFSPRAADLNTAQAAASDIRRLSIKALMQRLLSRFQVQDRRRSRK